MWCTQNFALISDGEIQDVIVCDNYDVANKLARTAYGDGAYARDVTRYPVQSGDIVKDNIFYRGKEVIKPHLTADEKIEELRAIEGELEDATCDLNVTVEQRLADIEEALCELSVMNGGTNNGENLA